MGTFEILKKNLKTAVVGRILIWPHDIHTWFYSHKYVTLHSKRDFADAIKVTSQMTLEMKIIQVGLTHHRSLLKAERFL